MHNIMITISKVCLTVIILIGTIFLFSGCAAKRENIYYWGNFEDRLYEYNQDDKSSVEQQIESLEFIIEKSKSIGKPVPPGLHAHLGLLYTNVGNQNKALEQLETEKLLFPESAQFMTFIQQKIASKSQGKKK